MPPPVSDARIAYPLSGTTTAIRTQRSGRIGVEHRLGDPEDGPAVGDELVLTRAVVVEHATRGVRHEAVELHRDLRVGPGEVEVAAPAADVDAVVDPRRRQSAGRGRCAATRASQMFAARASSGWRTASSSSTTAHPLRRRRPELAGRVLAAARARRVPARSRCPARLRTRVPASRPPRSMSGPSGCGGRDAVDGRPIGRRQSDRRCVTHGGQRRVGRAGGRSPRARAAARPGRRARRRSRRHATPFVTRVRPSRSAPVDRRAIDEPSDTREQLLPLPSIEPTPDR